MDSHMTPPDAFSSSTPDPDTELSDASSSTSLDTTIPVIVNGCTGKMGTCIIAVAESARLHILPVSFGTEETCGMTVGVCGKGIVLYGPSERERALASAFREYPNLIVVDFTVPDSVNDNAELYCKLGVPFVMGTSGGDRDRLFKTVEESNVYAVISKQMLKQVHAFMLAIKCMADQFPGLFSGYSLEVLESHQASKSDTSETAKSIISSFRKMGVSFDNDQIQMIRDREQQLEKVGIAEEFLDDHAFHLYRVASPDKTVLLEFQHKVCISLNYVEGAVEAIHFLSKKVKSKADKRVYNMYDVFQEGDM